MSLDITTSPSVVDRDPTSLSDYTESQKQLCGENENGSELGTVTCISGLLEGDTPTTRNPPVRYGKLTTETAESPCRQQEWEGGRVASERLPEETLPSPPSSVEGESGTRKQRRAKTKMVARFGPTKEEQARSKKGKPPPCV